MPAPTNGWASGRCPLPCAGALHDRQRRSGIPADETDESVQNKHREDVGVCQNLLSQRFDSKALNLVWVCDFTCVKVSGRFFHICVILDFYVGKVIACRVGSKFDRFPAIDILWDAVRLRGVSKGLMFHADQGTQFTSRDFRMVIDELGMVQSFSAKGHPYNNAVISHKQKRINLSPSKCTLSS